MREVPARLFGFIRELYRDNGLDVDGAQRGLRLAQVDVEAFGERVDWDELALFIERANEGLPDDEVVRIGAEYPKVHRWIRLLASQAVTPRLMFWLAWRGTPSAFPHMRVVSEHRGDLFHAEMHLPEPYRPCRPFFLGTVGELAAMPTLIGRPRARVDADAGPRHGIYDIHYGEPPSKRDRVLDAGGRMADELLGEMLRLVQWVQGSGQRPSRGLSSLELQARYGLTPAEARVVSHIAEGGRVAGVARDLKVSQHTVRSHLKAAFGKTGTHSQAELVRFVLVGGEPEPVDG